MVSNKTEEKVFSVSEYITFLNSILKHHSVMIRGEVGEKLYNYPKYTFFNLLEKETILRCFALQEVIEKVGVELEGGMEIIIVGHSKIYEKTGELKFHIEKIELIGEGILKKQFEVLKKRLSASGYFDAKHKKLIPRFPEKIGLITSTYGKGAKKDFLTNLGDLGFQISFYDSKVEGISAISEIIEAITWFNKNLPDIEVIVLTRGGGNWESLRPFNSEEIVKTIFASKIPIVTGIGHENDDTLADYAADLRASTPTHAAEVLTKEWEKADFFISEAGKTISSLLNKNFRNAKERINYFKDNFASKIKRDIDLQHRNLTNMMKNLDSSFQNYFRKFEVLQREFIKNISFIKKVLDMKKEKTKNLLDFLTSNNKKWLKSQKTILKHQEEKLAISSPQLKLKQGYSITSNREGKIIKEVDKLDISQDIITKFYKGNILSKIREIKR